MTTLTLADLTECVFAAWSPRIGDPSAMGWLTVVLYVAAAALAGRVAATKTERQRLFWLILAVLLACLAVNKQLDLQSALTAAGRCLARAQGWYAERRVVQDRFIIAVAVVSVLVALLLAGMFRRDLGRIWLALLGVVALMGFIVMRAAGFHHFDRFIAAEILNFRLNWLFEMGGIAMIAVNALWLLARRSGSRRQR